MIKQIAKNKIKLILVIAVFFFISYALQLNFAITLFILSLIMYLELRGMDSREHNLLNLTLLFVIIFVISYFILRRSLPVFYIPFCAIPMLTTLLFNELEISFLITSAISIAVASIAGNNFYLAVLFFVSGLSSSIMVLNTRRRSSIIRAGFIVGLIQALTLFFAERFWAGPLFRYPFLIANGIVSGMIVLGVLPVFEYLFKTITNISLLELADFNHPLLQRMVLEAPGTYHHSLVVGNLSEAACNVIAGANPLLARTGAYYHDIGKLQKPGYFSENQNIKDNKHDTLSPTISKLVIMNHVKDGIDLARRYRLNPRLIDFIAQHHGNSLVYYFYRRALENLEDDQGIKEEGFRYSGPKPDTKESAVVLLADSVEAATRALKEASGAKIEEVVHKIINNKFIDGQLDECDLTLKDLERIASVFNRILGGIYHSRVSYPERAQASEGNHKKPAKEDSHQPEKDTRSSP